MPKTKIQANIVGWGHTPFGTLPGETIESLIASAPKEAIVHACIDVSILEPIKL